ncbi:MAG TPA: RsmE family RNA methyltransferase [Saprospiraceae bacterium]|nr:RsmE family RNA methyltransferase [Saprospiraceae bacterium]
MGVNSLQWYYVPTLVKDEILVTIDGDEWHHCYNVVRLRDGDMLVVCNGKGLCFEGKIEKATPKSGQIRLTRDISNDFQHPRNYHIHIAVAPTKNIDRIEFAIEKLVEIGIDELTFLNCDHNERTRLRMDRMEKIVIAACKQSKKIHFPIVHDMTTPAKCIEFVKSYFISGKILCCHLDESSGAISENYSANENVVVLIGPEGGFSEAEIAMLKLNSVNLIHLGPHRLRVETAAIVACTGIHLLNQMKTKG